MKNFVFISPNFPEQYWRFCEGLKNDGFRVLGVGDCPYDELKPELRNCLTEYYRVYDMNNNDRQVEAISYFINKYGPIDYLESNNEYWLRSDAKLRERFNIWGLKPSDMDRITNKEKMKECFKKAGAKVARYHMVDNIKECQKFIKKVDYPVFVKPAVGVGAQKTYKISNERDLEKFFFDRDVNTSYIMEEFITGNLMSFDGVCNSKGECVWCDESHFTTPIDIVLHENLDDKYYTTAFVNPKFEKLGRAVVKAFDIKKRFFHIEFFQLTIDKKGLGKKGDYIALETNMRAPGGSVPDLINFACSISCYQVWADVQAYDESRQNMNYEKFIAMAASRRDRFHYVHSWDEVKEKYPNNVCLIGRNPDILADALGNDFVFSKFKDMKEANAFADFVLEKYNN